MSQIIIKSANNEACFELEIAKTIEEREKGLMYRNSLAKDAAMLFIFEKPQVVNFWMKHTKIPLDMIFIDENLRIVHIEEHTNPCLETAKDCPVYSSELPIKYVLEINADLVKEKNIHESDIVILNL